MREIKFRLYTTMTPKKMYQWDEIKTFLGFDDFYQPENIWMQYTGLHDKAGKEAYDFDICVMDERQSKWIIYPVKCGSCICTIDEWKQSNGHPILTNALSEMQNEQCFEESSTIIGNIFENPELMESVEE